MPMLKNAWMKVSGRALLLVAPALLMGLSGCGSPVLSAAKTGELPRFEKELKGRLGEGQVDVSEARSIAEHWLGAEIRNAEGYTGKRSLSHLGACGSDMDGSLADRAEKPDELAARATLIRFDLGSESELDYASFVTHKNDLWRAVGARSLTNRGGESKRLKDAGTWRRRLMVDPATEVRLAAVKAAKVARDRADVAALIEAARLDPDLEVRHVAMRALGRLGGGQALDGLRDLFRASGEETRLVLIAALDELRHLTVVNLESCKVASEHDAERASCGALRLLRRQFDSVPTMPGVRAALALAGGEDGDDAGEAKAERAAATAFLERAIDDSPARIRVAAIAGADLSKARLAEAIVDAGKDSDEDRVVVAARTRMLELTSAEKKESLEVLGKIAKKDTPSGDSARMVLASQGDRSVVSFFEADAKGAAVSDRVRAARGFARLGEMNKALPLLADADVAVRTQAACAIIRRD